MKREKESIDFDKLAPGDIFYVIQPHRQYFVKIEPYEDENGRYNAEKLDSGIRIFFQTSERFPIYPDDGRTGWKKPNK